MSGLRSILSRLLQVVFVVLCVSSSVSAQTPTGDVVITTNTSWPTATYNLTSLTVQGGAILTIGGGSTVNVSGAIAVTANSTIVAQSINNTTQVNGSWQGAGVTFTAGSVSIDPGSSLNADGQGYVTNAGPGGGGGSSGGSYGGLGGGNSPGAVYGSAAMPVDLGSGGGNAQYGGSSGGGAIRLMVSGTLTLNGTISANGSPVPVDTYGGGGAAGSGGSVYVTTAALMGAGSFQANGGANATPAATGAAAGGGGRAAVYFSGPSNFTGFNSSTAAGGVYTGTYLSNGAGSNGTVAFLDTSASNNSLNLYQNYTLPANSSVTFNNLTVANGATLTIGGGSTVNVSGAITVTGNSTIVAQSINNTAQVNGTWQGAGVTFAAASVSIDAGSSLNADGQGYVTNAGPGDGTSASGGSGGSYGGAGGYNPGPTYGSAPMPVDLGSGGVAAQYGGSNGGGAIRLTVSGTLTLNGTISANGSAVPMDTYGGGGGAGSGGSVYVTAATLTGAGTFQAKGGDNTTPAYTGSAAGGGGRVAIYYTGPSTFSGFTSSTASGGVYTSTSLSNGAGANGTIAFFDTSVTNSNVAVYQAYAVPANSNLSYNSLTISNGATFTIGGGANVALAGAATITGNSTVLVGSINNTAQVNAAWQGAGATISAASLTLDAGSSIVADNQGYITGEGPGAGTYTGGASYGGLGTVGLYGGTSGPVYGSATAPVDLGSGGANGQNQGGGPGGGAIHLQVSGTFTDNGIISANGGSLTASNGGAGAGGSIYVQAATIAGSGTLSANGGSNTTGSSPVGGGGGGGRISVTYTNNQGFSKNSISVNGGSGGGPNASAGTINFSQGAALSFLQPSVPAVHGTITVQWFSNSGVSTTVNVAGPQASVIATGGVGLSSASWDTTRIPDGAYELRLTAFDASGTTIAAISKDVVVNNSVTWVSGTLTANTHWTANHVYVLEGDLTIPSGITLTIDPGTVVKSLAKYQILVQSGGTLTALGGDSSTPVIFTTFDDSSAGGNTSFGVGTPQPGEWGGIDVLTGGTLNTNTYTFVRYAHGVLGSTITTNTTLLSSQVYEISGTLGVPSGVSLTIQPGAVLKFEAGASISVAAGGALIANGTLAQPIYFTSINDQSVGTNLVSQSNPNATLVAPAPGDWNSININGTASFTFVHMLYGGGPIPTVAQTGMIDIGGSATAVTLSNSTLASSYYIGVEVDGGTLTVSNSIFYANQDRAINSFGTTHIVNSTFDGNAAGPYDHGGSMDIENSVITGFTNTQFGGVGGAVSPFLNNNVYTATPNIPRYIGIPDQTGTNGNISAAPVYMNGPEHDYRPTYGSPLIDAGNGTVANYPTADAFNDPRYNAPLVTTKTGTPDTSGKYPDIGAFEFVQSAPSDLDLTVSGVQGPASAVVGTQVQVTWTVTNVGVGTVYGPWHDAVYLVRNPSTNPVEIFAGQVLSGQNTILGPGATYTGTAIVTLPGTVVGEHSWEVKTNVLGEVFEGANSANNKAVSLDPVVVDVPALTAGAGPVSGSFVAAGQAVYYKVVPSATQSTSVQLVLLPPATGSVQLFVGGGYVPTPQHYDYQQVEFNSSTASVVIPAGSAQTYYVTAYPQTLGASSTPFTITAKTLQFSLTSVTPGLAVAGGTATLTFVGGDFTTNTTFKLLSAAGTAYTPTSVFLSDSDHAQVTFDLSQAAAGNYTAQATDGSTLILANALSVIRAGGTSTIPVTASPKVQVSLETPTAFRKGFPSIVTLNYKNISDTDIPAPMLYISAGGATLSEVQPACDGCDPNFNFKNANTFYSGLALGINHEGPAGILPAGASGSIQYFATPGAAGGVTFDAQASTVDLVASQLGINYCSSNGEVIPGQEDCVLVQGQTGAYAAATDFCAGLTPAGVSAAAFSRTCMQMLNNAGYTYAPGYNPGQTISGPPTEAGQFVLGHLSLNGLDGILAADATALSASGIYEYDTEKLVAFELEKDGLSELAARYHKGAFGYGPSHPFDLTLSDAGGTPVVTYPNGSTRLFATPSPNVASVYLGPIGDYATVTHQADGSWLLTEVNGIVFHFATGTSPYLLDYVLDRAGNRISLTYTNGQLTSVSDGFGSTASFQWNSSGQIASATDPDGRVTTYTYDSGSFLTSVTDTTGTTIFNWIEGGSHGVGYIDDRCIATFCEPAVALSSVAYSDGTHSYYTYDAAGRLTGSSLDNNANAITYTHNADGSITRTDALGKSTTTAATVSGAVATVINPLDKVIRYRFDPENKLVSILGPLGDADALSYDQSGNLTSLQSATGSQTTIAHTSDQSPTSITAPTGDTTSFSYDAALNETSSTYPNGQNVTYTYDANGRLLTRTNRRGQTTAFAYGPNGTLASKTFSDGSRVQYTYDAHRNVQSVTTAAGTVYYTYDAADHLTNVSNPDGTSLTYAYNTNGQRTRMTDSTGYVTNYTWDLAGRLANLTDGSGGPIVSYTYNARGELTGKSFGNGTSTAVTYDATGNALSIVNYSPSHGVISEYDYTYNAAGDPLTANGPTGNLGYSYDLDGQLTGVNTPSGAIAYNYDASGNRVSVTTKGVTSAYQINNLGEYTAANGTGYLYDADGNLVFGNGWTYTYNEENKLLTMANSTDSWSFQYDGLENRVATIHNGTQTRFLIDPSDNGNVAAELDHNGAVIAHYTYGIDLTSTVQTSGTSGYYLFDVNSNTTQITGASGAVVNSYSYLPFGEKTVLSATMHNPFTFSGGAGVQDDGTGMYVTRNRIYNPQLGRFHQLDPAGLDGGLNLYQYVHNQPTRTIDPTGLVESGGGILSPALDIFHPDRNSSGPPSGDAFYDFGNTGAGHLLNAVGGELPGLAGFSGGTASNILTLDSFSHNVNSGNYYGALHDGTLGICRQLSLFLPETKPTNPIGALIFTIKHIGAIDEISQAAFNHYFIPDDPIPDGIPVTKLPNICGSCINRPGNPHTVPVQGSIDPNSKMTSGFGDQGFVPAGVPITYTIYFENQPTATLPAQKVIVTDALAANLDWSTVQLNAINFNNVTLTVPDGTQTYSAQANVSTDPNPVSVAAALNPATGVLTWTMQSVDPITGSTPANPLAGFLPPNNSASAGVGYVTFSVMPKQNLANAASITNQASIVFDVNAPISTNTVTNTLDLSAPTSAINPLPATTTNSTIPVSWTGNDPSGSGIASYNIYVSIDGGTYSLWLSGTTLTSSNYSAYPGHKFSFISMATDNVGSYQTTPGTPQTVAVTSSALVTPTVTVTPATSSILTTQSLSVTIKVVGAGTTTPTGSVVLSSASFASSATTITSGAATIVIPAGALAAGMDTLLATYTPDSIGAQNYASNTGSAVVTVGSPNVQVTVGTSPAGEAFSVDGTSYTTAQTLTWAAGSTHTLTTISPQTALGTQANFVSWSDAGAISHTVTASSSTANYTATFSLAYLLTTQAAPVAGGSVTPASGTYYASGTLVPITAMPAASYQFSNWTGNVTSTSSASTTVTMSAPQSVTANFTLLAAPQVSLTPTSLSFTSAAGVVSAAQTVTLMNTGTGPLNLSSTTLTGANASAFAQTSTCATSVAAGASCTFSVTFTPASSGGYSASLTIADSAANSPQTVSLTGTGGPSPAFSLSATPPQQTITLSQTATYTIIVAPTGGPFTSAVTLTASGLPSGATATFTPSSVTPGSTAATSTLSIRFPSGHAENRPARQFPTNGPIFAAVSLAVLATCRRRRLLNIALLAALLVVTLAGIGGCGTSPANYTITVTGSGGNGQTASTTVDLTTH